MVESKDGRVAEWQSGEEVSCMVTCWVQGGKVNAAAWVREASL